MRAVVFLPLTLLVASCHGTGTSPDEGPSGSRTYQVSGAAQAIDLRGPDNLLINHGAVLSISASGPTAVLDKLTFKIDSGTLVIDRGPGAYSSAGAKITVTIPALAGIAIDGSGDVRIDHVEGPRFASSQAGSGDLYIGNIQAQTASFVLSGTGDLHATGHVGALTVNASGTASADLGSLSSDQATLLVAGTGDIETGETKTATVTSSGTGDVKVAGHPVCSIAKSGTGNVKCG